MKILTPEQIRWADAYTIEHEPIASIDLMERAANALCRHFTYDFSPPGPVHLFCGPGNNGGDGLALARMISSRGFRTNVHIIAFTDRTSQDFNINLERLRACPDISINKITDATELPAPERESIVVDALFGSGLNKSLKGLPAATVRLMCDHPGKVMAIDIPSGLYADAPVDGPAVRADLVYTFQVPRLAFFMPASEPFIGQWKILDIGLSAEGLRQLDTPDSYFNMANAQRTYRKRGRFSHKGTCGHALLVAGSEGKAGAAVLAAKAALRSGAGLLTLQLPSGLFPILQTAVPEAMCQPDDRPDLTGIPPGQFEAVGIGPGLGTSKGALETLRSICSECSQPMVIDADGLNLLAAHPELWELVPANSILTPHPGEFRRLTGDWADDYEKIRKQRSLAAERKMIVVLKGAHTSVADPDGNISFNSTGNQGMATAGSGDTLTGMITGLLAQGYPAGDAARFGVFVHGLAGDMALQQQHPNSLIASDIIEHIGTALQHIDLRA